MLSIDPSKIPTKDLHQYILGAVSPRPIAFASTISTEGVPNLAPIEIGQVFRLNNVFFDFDKFDLRNESFAELDRVVKFLNDYPNVEIELSAHTDAKGSDTYNFTLSDNRAKSVREYIISKGIAVARVISRGYGEQQPVSTNDNDEGRQLNRRVEFKILKN